MQEPVFLPIAQVHTPQGSVRYVAQARSHQGFLVQRRYRGVGEPHYSTSTSSPWNFWVSYEYVKACLEPLLNLGAVQAAGLSATAIRAWIADHPGEVFTHPVYASLCLRWGENTYGYRVEELEEPELTPEAVPFTPHTCWESGTTYYQWAAAPNADQDLLEQIRLPAYLQNHVREIGQEGGWFGWYSTDYRALHHALAAQGRRLVLAQPRMCYGVFTQDCGTLTVLMTADGAEEAYAYYAALPEAPETYRGPTSEGNCVGYGYFVQWPGQAAGEWGLTCDKRVLEPNGEQQYLNYTANGGLVINRMRANDLHEQEFPQHVPLVTLAAVLATTGLVRWRLAEALGWTLEELSEREKDPGRVTIAEVERVGELTQRPVEQLLRELREEMRARTKLAQVAQQRSQPMP
ncbi:hypothetical protein [Hymenobacter arizonensis]|uniref:Uncharacterized protein n=1 Tax=Hymenobacter arizonensis TaxID=1227077 RepID=A0A1I5YZ95_HYMAR|nr:hypothetical protein [Hymenobacter arizonensis]SFQ49440.1 hypothetical protein SAMN04515668_2554 [Hymenobacter arizonensis]